MSADKTHINPKRLQWCLNTFDFTLENFAHAVKISHSTLQKAMKGETIITIKQLEKLSIFFNRSLLFFINPDDIDETKIYPAQFRTINNKKPIKDRKLSAFILRVEKQRQIFLGLNEYLEKPINDEWLQWAKYNQEKSINKFTQEIRATLELDECIDFNKLRAQVENKGVMIIVSNGYQGDWQIDKTNPVVGFSLYYETLPVIVIKKQDSKERQSFTLLHELAHLLLHKESMIDENNYFDNYKDKEKQANEFAGKLLVPDNFLQQIDTNKISDNAHQIDVYLNDFKKKWGVSKEVILIRLLQSNQIKQEIYNNYKKLQQEKYTQQSHKDIGGQRWRHKEPLHIFGRNYVNMVFDALSHQHITLSKASTYLDNLQINHLKKLRDDL